MKKYDFLALGYADLDCTCMLPVLETDGKVRISERILIGGGPASTAAVAAARLGLKTAFIGAVGDDDAGRKIISDFKDENVDVSNILIRKDAESASAYCMIDSRTGKKCIAWTPGTAPAITPDEINPDVIRSCGILHLDGNHPDAAVYASKIARDAGIPVMLDADEALAGQGGRLLEYCGIVIASERFAEKYSGSENPEDGLRAIAAAGAEIAVITLGERGSAALGKDGTIIRCPAFRVNAVDTTGAGDVFHGAFAVRLLETSDIMECMRFASAAAALKCTKPGGRAGIPSRAATDAFLSR